MFMPFLTLDSMVKTPNNLGALVGLKISSKI